MKIQRNPSIQLFISLVAVVILSVQGLFAKEPVVSNVLIKPRPETKLVDITYDLDAFSNSAYVEIAISELGDGNYNLPLLSLTGDVGTSPQDSGKGKKITWNAGADWKGKITSKAVARVRAYRISKPSDFAHIPAGQFMMGDTFAEGDSNELPARVVHVSAFALQKKEVTKAQWDAVRKWGSAHGYEDLREGEGKGANHPVHTVSWHDVVKWCNAKSEMEGKPVVYTIGGATYKIGNSTPVINYTAKGYRLPTEAEWEKAARGGKTGKRFPWGDTIDHSRANYNANGGDYAYDVSSYKIYTYHPAYNDGTDPYTSPVGKFEKGKNGYGLYDMTGNVDEWCNDSYGSSYYRATGNTTDPTGPATGLHRVYRGGSWIDAANDARCANRNDDRSVLTDESIGFRPALGQ